MVASLAARIDEAREPPQLRLCRGRGPNPRRRRKVDRASVGSRLRCLSRGQRRSRVPVYGAWGIHSDSTAADPPGEHGWYSPMGWVFTKLSSYGEPITLCTTSCTCTGRSWPPCSRPLSPPAALTASARPASSTNGPCGAEACVAGSRRARRRFTEAAQVRLRSGSGQ
jgi:hypothetical protein